MANTDYEINRKKKKKFGFGYIYLFLFIFFAALAFFSYMVDSLSPDIDVTIGNNDNSMTLGEADIDVEIKAIDERLKWIQMEDDLPSVAIRNSDEIQKKEKSKKEEIKIEPEKDVKKEPPRPDIKEIVKLPDSDFRGTPITEKKIEPVIPAPKPSITKIYLGSYSTIDEAMTIQSEVSKKLPEISPFVKSANGSFIVQLGSFSNKERAESLIIKLKEQGFSPKINYEN